MNNESTTESATPDNEESYSVLALTRGLESPQNWPALDAAQAFVVPSYQWMISRVEAADSRIHTLAAFVSTVTLAVPAVSRALDENMPFGSVWFAAAMVLAGISIGIAIVARLVGALRLPDPARLYETSLNLQEWEFKKDALFHAGEAFKHNRSLVRQKATALNWMGGCFLLEVLCLLIWTFLA